VKRAQVWGLVSLTKPKLALRVCAVSGGGGGISYVPCLFHEHTLYSQLDII